MKRLFNMKSMLIFYLVYEFLELIHTTQSYHFNFYSDDCACLPLPSLSSLTFLSPFSVFQELGTAYWPGAALPPDHRLASPVHTGLQDCMSPASTKVK